MARVEFLAIFIIAIILAISLQQAFGLKCWECNSNKQSVCTGDKLPEEMLKDCDPSFQSPVCLKLASTSFGYVQRICRENNATANRDCDEARVHDEAVFCGICQTDQCNAAPSQYGSAAVLAAIPIAIMQLLLH